MRLALLFSGQGQQGARHWQEIALSASAECLRALADVGVDVQSMDSGLWSVNRIAQPMIFALQMRRWQQLRERLPLPVCAAGYSLGEVAAVCAAGGFTMAQGLQLCVERARLMDLAVPGVHAMLAVLGLGEDEVGAGAQRLGLHVAIRNGPRHFVVAGAGDAINLAELEFERLGATHLSRLDVQTPSHTPWLKPAAHAFAQALATLPARRLAFPVLSAVDAHPAGHTDIALPALAQQICTPLDWAACLQTVREMQADAVLEIGPGNALARMFAELAPEMPARACDDFRSLDGVVAWLDRCA